MQDLTPTGDTVVLLHGLGRTPWSFLLTRRRLATAGFRAIGIRYPSRKQSIEKLAQGVAERLPAASGGRLHFLTHSLGGIVARQLLAHTRPDNLGRVVMLCPPNQGSQLAELLRPNPLFRFATGPAGQQLGTTGNGPIADLGPVDFETGVITGVRRMNPLSRLIKGESDGKVAVEEAKVEGMADFLVVPAGHSFIMNDPLVLDQAIHFFRHGRFARGSSWA
jgi:pimeloyl-ACP methyl ester carboxylesterase